MPSQVHCASRITPFASFVMAFVMCFALPAFAAPPQPTAPVCAIANDAAAVMMHERWSAAISSRNPDEITRLFVGDATMRGFASDTVRTDYTQIRDYYFRLLQLTPQIRFEENLIDGGCNYFSEIGNVVWEVNPEGRPEPVALSARYRLLYQYSQNRWRIAELVEELTIPEAEVATLASVTALFTPPEIVVASNGAAVAGFLRREPSSASTSGPLNQTTRVAEIPPASIPVLQASQSSSTASTFSAFKAGASGVQLNSGRSALGLQPRRRHRSPRVKLSDGAANWPLHDRIELFEISR